MISLNLQNFKIQLHLFLLDEILTGFYFLRLFIVYYFFFSVLEVL